MGDLFTEVYLSADEKTQRLLDIIARERNDKDASIRDLKEALRFSENEYDKLFERAQVLIFYLAKYPGRKDSVLSAWRHGYSIEDDE